MVMTYLMSEDTEGNKVVRVDDNGLPIVIDDEKPEGEQEFGIDAIHLINKVPALQEEAKNHRLKAKEFSEKLQAFEGIDPVKATEAIAIAKNLSAGDLKKKEEVERIKQETEEAWKLKFDSLSAQHQEILNAKEQSLAKLDQDLRTSLLTSQFAKSPHFTGKNPTTKLPPDIAEAHFGKNFKVEEVNGVKRAVGYLNGNAILSKSKPGELADFDEAVERMIDGYSNKDSILFKSTGTGALGGGTNFHRGLVIKSGDQEAFGENLEAIAKGEVTVV